MTEGHSVNYPFGFSAKSVFFGSLWRQFESKSKSGALNKWLYRKSFHETAFVCFGNKSSLKLCYGYAWKQLNTK